MTATSHVPASTRDKSQAADATSPRQTMRNALIITRREVRDSLRDWRIIVPIVILTFFFPFLAQNVATSFANFLEGFGANVIGERTIPFLLMIVGFFPISISLVIALETFVGEKERRSLEPLLSTPLTNTELYIGKTLAAIIPPLIASFGGMTFYLLLLLNSELAWRPQPMLIVQIFLLTIIQALVMVTGAVVVSSQTTSTRAANLLASFIIIPMALIINGESVIMFLAPDAESPRGIGALWAIIVGMFIVVILLLRIGNSIFNREELLGRTIDTINLSGTFRKIWRYIIAVDEEGTPARNILDWYRRSIVGAIVALRTPIFITIGVFVFAFIAGYGIGLTPQWQMNLPSQERLDTIMQGQAPYFLEFFTLDIRQQAMMSIFWQNLRILLGALLLSIFTFGVVAYLIVPITFALLGYILSQIILAGWDAGIYILAVVPHGIVEIPLVVIMTAASFQLGAVVTRPPRQWTVGHAWVVTFALNVRLLIALIIPGLLIAAMIEIFLTPNLVIAFFGM